MFDPDLTNPLLMFPRQAGCVQCPDPLPCSCAANQNCERTVQTCTSCASNVCVADPNASKGKGGVSNGALAGAIIGCIFLFTLVVTGFFVWRRRMRAKKAALLALEKTTISPFDLQGPNVLNSPLSLAHSPHSPAFSHSQSPTSPHHSQYGDVRVYRNSGVINLDPSGGSPIRLDNPFSDAASMSTMGTNVIPIAYMPPNSTSMSIADGMAPPPSASSSAPSRPARSPDLHLRLPPHAVSRASMVDNNGGDLLAPRSPYTAQSTRSGVSVASSRASTMSGVSSVYDRPTIVTSAKVGRQVLGVVRAEVVQVPSMPGTPNGALTPGAGGAAGLRARASVRSPLAGPSFSPGDIEMRRSPSPPPPVPGIPQPLSPTMSVRSNPFSDLKAGQQDVLLRTPVSPTSQPLPPSSPPSPTPSEAMMMRNDTFPPMSADLETPRAARHIPRESTSSFVSATSRADSILNTGFVFFPPSPGSNGPSHFAPQDPRETLGRRTLGFSTYSTSSNVSSGLEAFPFHFSNGGPNGGGGQPESARNTGMPGMPMSMSTLAGAGYVPQDQPTNRAGVRASLDTLALSRDVEAYPLGFDRQQQNGGPPSGYAPRSNGV